MFIVTAKLTKGKLIGILCAAAAVILLVIGLANRPEDAVETGSIKLQSPSSRVEYLASCGYKVSQPPVKTQEVLIPEDFSEVYLQYNALQKSQGFDLSKYQGKTVMQYVYAVEDQPEDGNPVYATLLVYKDKLIGADLSRGGENGFLRPLLTA